MSEVVIEYKAIVGSSACQEKGLQVVYKGLSALGSLQLFGDSGPSEIGLPAGSRHFSSSGICRVCASMRKAAYTSSSSSRECAEKSHRLIASAMASSFAESMLGSVL